MHEMRNRALSLLAVLAVAACSGSNGSPGAPGAPGVSTGTVQGTLTYKPGSTTLPATNVNVTTSPVATDSSGTAITAVSGADGTYSLTLPVGVYTIQFGGNAFSAASVAGVSVLAGKTTTIDKLLTATNPLVVAAASTIPNPAGFNKQITLGVTVSGGTAPYTYQWAPKGVRPDGNSTTTVYNPTAVTLSSATADAPTFTTGSVAAIVAKVKTLYKFCPNAGDSTNCTTGGVGFGPTIDPGTGATQRDSEFLPVSSDAQAKMTYNIDCTVTDAQGFTKTVTVAVVPATLAQGNQVVPVNQSVVAFFSGNATDLAFAKPATSIAVLNDKNTAYPWFVPDVPGNYVIGTGATALTVNASNYQSANKDCGVCHGFSQATRDAVAAKFKDWGNSAHGNHFFKYMHYDNSGTLVWNTDQYGNRIPGPTANPGVFWSNPGAMTTFQFGMTGAEGTHYSASCVACHTTGYNAVASNNGMDDVMRANSWTFPNLTTVFPTLTGPTSAQVAGADGTVSTVTYDQVTAAPVMTAWNAMPAAVKAYAGMQCESCHGPLGAHTAQSLAYYPDGNTYVKPVGEYGVAACAVCHERPSNHDRVTLWRQSGHANAEVAIAEVAIHATGNNPDASCGRCHAAQGYVQWLKQQQRKGEGGYSTTDPRSPGAIKQPNGTAADANYLKGLGLTKAATMPITCAACHDAHTTDVRVKDSTGLLPSGFSVAGAGTGALCMTCHNSRNGPRGDSFSPTTLTQYASLADGTAAPPPTAIGAPHEANQTDIYVGRNAYFTTGNAGFAKANGHQAVAESCVGCHMNLFPDGKTGTNTNHTWTINKTVCKHCHGEEVNGEALEAKLTADYAALFAKLQTTACARLPSTFTIRGAPTTTVPNPQNATVNRSNITACTITTGRSLSFKLTFDVAINDVKKASGTVAAGTVVTVAYNTIFNDSGVSDGTFNTLDGLLAKANWNYTLAAAGSSTTVPDAFHNPSFVSNVISATSAALDAGPGSCGTVTAAASWPACADPNSAGTGTNGKNAGGEVIVQCVPAMQGCW